jgi:LPS export ABC transporter protein LptC
MVMRNKAWLAALVCLLPLTGCQTQPPAKPKPKAEKTAPVMGQDVTFIVTQNGKKSWVLHADQATYSADQRVANLVTVKGQTYNAAGKAVAEFTAPAGRYDQADKNITLLNGVTAKSMADKPVTLTAPTLTWKSNQPDATATGGVTVQNPGFGKSTANQCQFSLDFSRIALQGNANTTTQ